MRLTKEELTKKLNKTENDILGLELLVSDISKQRDELINNDLRLNAKIKSLDYTINEERERNVAFSKRIDDQTEQLTAYDQENTRLLEVLEDLEEKNRNLGSENLKLKQKVTKQSDIIKSLSEIL